MIAFTNHALDHILTSVLDAGITNKVARLGSRSTDERISKFSIKKLEVVAGQSHLDRSLARNHPELKAIERELEAFMNNSTQSAITPEEITHYIETQYPDFSKHFEDPPCRISTIHKLSVDTEDNWQRVGRHNRELDANDSSLYGFWMRGGDLAFRPLIPSQSSSETEPLHGVIQDINFSDLRDPDRFPPAFGRQPQLPRSDRPLAELLASGEVWKFSASERKRLHDFWSQEVREATRENKLDEFTRLREKYRESFQVFNEGKSEVNHGQYALDRFLDNYQTRRQLLENVDIVACTTTGMVIPSFTFMNQ